MKEELIALGKVLQNDFENTISQQITDLLTNDFSTDVDWQELENLEAELSSFFEINNQFAALEAWLTSGFMPGEVPDFDLATPEWIASDFSRYLENLSPKRREALNSPPSLVGKGVGGLGLALTFPHDVKSQWIAARGESLPISSPHMLNPKNAVWNQPGNSDLPSSGQPRESSLIEDIENITQQEDKRSPLQPEISTSMAGNYVKSVTQQEDKRSPLGLKQLANFLASEPYLDDFENVINQQTKVIQPEIQTAYFSSQDGEELQEETKIDWTDLISKTIPQNNYPILENHNIDSYPDRNHKAQISKTLTSHPELFNQETQIEIEPNSARSLNHNSEIDMDLIMEAIAQEINREYRRFYGS